MSEKTVYIVLFRGVGGKTQLPVGPLREALSQAGFENVATYINSGNAVVKSALSREEVAPASPKSAHVTFPSTRRCMSSLPRNGTG